MRFLIIVYLLKSAALFNSIIVILYESAYCRGMYHIISRGVFKMALKSFDYRTQFLQSAFNILVPPINLLDIIDDASSLSR